MSNLTIQHQEMIKGLIELGVSQKVIAFMMFVLQEKQQIVDAAKYITMKAEEGQMITDDVILKYTMDILKESMEEK